MAHQFAQGGVQVVAVEEHYRLRLAEEGHRGQGRHHLVDSAQAAVERHEHVGVLLHHLLALVEGGAEEVHGVVGVHGVDTVLRHHAHHNGSGLAGGMGHFVHKAAREAAIHELMAVPAYPLPESAGVINHFLRQAVLGRAVNGNSHSVGILCAKIRKFRNFAPMERKDFEIMAPVGSYESLSAAIAAGADAVYFGVEGLNMRARSSVNFTLDDLRRIASICNEAGVKTYLTVNTIIYDDEMEKCRGIIDAARQAGITAIIASDMAAILYARSVGVEVHISTQLSVSNTATVRFLSQYADVVVLARELSLERVRAIRDAIEAEDIRGPRGELVKIEMFCHGALCMAVSGKCYLSLHQMNSSANRGACTQICRRSYTVTDRETGDSLDVENQYIMSPKDLKTIHFLNKMVDAGVRVFKIEGRARGPEYVSLAVRCYDEALRALCDGTYSEEKISRWDTELSKIFNRGFWDGYYLGQRLGEWSAKYGSSATRVKEYRAKGVRYFSKIGVAEFYLENGELRPGDEIVITGPTTGALVLTLDEIRVNLKPVEVARKGDSFSIAVPSKIRPSDRLYLWRKK